MKDCTRPCPSTASHPCTGVLVFSQYIETRYAAELLAGTPAGVGYLLKDRVANVSEFLAAMHRVASGGTALDPEVVRQPDRRQPPRQRTSRASPRANARYWR